MTVVRARASRSFAYRAGSWIFLLTATLLFAVQLYFAVWAIGYDELSSVTPLGFLVLGEPFYLVASSVIWVPLVVLSSVAAAAAGVKDTLVTRATRGLLIASACLAASALVIGYS